MHQRYGGFKVAAATHDGTVVAQDAALGVAVIGLAVWHLADVQQQASALGELAYGVLQCGVVGGVAVAVAQ